MPETMWAVAGGIIIGGLVLALLRAGFAFLLEGGWLSGLGILMLIVGAYCAVYVVSFRVFGIHFEGNTMVRDG